jgi:hypothetical protein
MNGTNPFTWTLELFIITYVFFKKSTKVTQSPIVPTSTCHIQLIELRPSNPSDGKSDYSVTCCANIWNLKSKILIMEIPRINPNLFPLVQNYSQEHVLQSKQNMMKWKIYAELDWKHQNKIIQESCLMFIKLSFCSVYDDSYYVPLLFSVNIDNSLTVDENSK